MTTMNVEDILGRNDYELMVSASPYHIVHRSAGPPVAEIHVRTSAHLVLPESKVASRLPDTIIPNLIQPKPAHSSSSDNTSVPTEATEATEASEATVPTDS